MIAREGAAFGRGDLWPLWGALIMIAAVSVLPAEAASFAYVTNDVAFGTVSVTDAARNTGCRQSSPVVIASLRYSHGWKGALR